jgi:hypothetical protein
VRLGHQIYHAIQPRASSAGIERLKPLRAWCWRVGPEFWSDGLGRLFHQCEFLVYHYQSARTDRRQLPIVYAFRFEVVRMQEPWAKISSSSLACLDA